VGAEKRRSGDTISSNFEPQEETQNTVKCIGIKKIKRRGQAGPTHKFAFIAAGYSALAVERRRTKRAELIWGRL